LPGTSLAIVAAILLTGVSSRADPGSRNSTAGSEEGYGYIFDDDVMQAGVMKPSDPRIAIVIHGTRQQLIRPRTAFVHELLKTIENL
jgi:hypothetical protein